MYRAVFLRSFRPLAVILGLGAIACTPGESEDEKGAANAKADADTLKAEAEADAGADPAPTEVETTSATEAETGGDAPGKVAAAADAFEVPGKATDAGWSCLCFREKGNEGPEDVTACRRTPKACGALQRRVAGGSPTILRNSTPEGKGCRVVGEATHPGDVLGEKAGWKPSAREGAFSYLGKCLLKDDVSTTSELEYALGPLSLGMSTDAVVKALGEPDSRGQVILEEATGEYVQDWDYEDEGLELSMYSGSKDGEQVLGAIFAIAPCTLKTPRGVGLGSAFSEVGSAYARFSAPKWEHGEDSFVAGSIYGGVIFNEGKAEGTDADDPTVVTSIFIGAAAE